MSDVFENKGALAATIVVAASNSLNKGQANYVCDGVNDHVEIQAALDALPATGGEVKLLDGTYNIEVALVLDSYQTLRGCGRNTILTTTTANLDIITATGGSGTEKVGILIADLCVDGNAGGVANFIGILLTYVDHSKISNIWSLDNGDDGIKLSYSDFNALTNNTCLSNGYSAISVYNSSNNTLSGNVCQDSNYYGITLGSSTLNTVIGNICLSNFYYGIRLISSNNNIIVGNTCQGNGRYGLYVGGSNNIVIGNMCLENSQTTSNTYDNIYLVDSDYNSIQGNTCRAGALANKPRYGINISNVACNGNLVTNNDIYNDGFGTGSFNNAGTGTVTAAGNRV